MENTNGVSLTMVSIFYLTLPGQHILSWRSEKLQRHEDLMVSKGHLIVMLLYFPAYAQ